MKNGKTFEEQMNRLQEIVSELEKDTNNLDNSISLYEEGLTLSKQLKKQLSQYEDKIKKMTDDEQ